MRSKSEGTVRRTLTYLFGTAAALSLSFGFAAAVFAADMGRPAPIYTKAPPLPPVYSWTGFYVGGEVGGEWGNTTWTTTSLVNPPLVVNVDSSSPAKFNPTSVRAGGYVGYNWQWAPQWLAGLEADLADANKTVNGVGIPGCAILCTAGFPGPGVDTSSVKMGWDASVRARLGYLITPSVLAYGTGGVAWQDVQVSATCQHSVPDPLCLFVAGNPSATATDSVVRTGWTVGAGIESLIGGHWLLRGEYRYSNFGTWSNVLNLSVPGSTTTVTDQLKISTQIATLGLAYKF
jgi:outer membrane immunogenic protein